MRIQFFAFISLALFLVNCTSDNGEKLAQRSCGSCHEFPKAELLDKQTWKEHVLPRMGAWLGMGNIDILINDMSSENDYGQSLSQSLVPPSPQISESDWQLIQDYYIENAPDELQAEVFPKEYKDLAEKFTFETKKMGTLSRPASNTTIHFDVHKKQFFIADNDGEVTVSDSNLKEINTAKFESTVSSILTNAGKAYDALLMGKIRPNNQSIGSLNDGSKTVIKGLFRPVFMEKSDLNQDGIEDYLICNFGYHVGKLSWYEFDASGQYQEHILLPVAGAIKTKIEDINKDGLPDILVLMTQGNESIFYFENLGKGEFKTEKWLSVPPVYGSSDFEWADINNDGHKDIVIACGDNGDFSLIRKPYHGVRIFLNDGRNHFKEGLFIPLQGATGLKLADYDKDGDLDIAVIANFANFSIKPHRSFVLYDNLGNLKFEAYVSNKTDIGRWLVLEKGDFDSDGDTDLILGSHLINLMVERETLIEWKNHQTDVLVLKNKSK